MLERQSVKSKVASFIFEKFPLAQKRLGEKDSLLETGIVDSIGVLEIVSFIEEAFAVQVTDEDLVPENFGSIAAIVAFVERQLEKPAIQEAEGTTCER